MSGEAGDGNEDLPPRLVAPSPALARSYVGALGEGFRRGTLPRASAGRIAAVAADFEGYLAELTDQTGSVTLPNGLEVPKVPFSIHWLVRGRDTFLGELSLRHALNGWLRLSGGHVGYGIRPGAQGRGFGKLVLRLGLGRARALGLRRVLVTAHEDNPASCRVIEANGGTLEDTVPDVFGGGPLRRYWIELG